MADYDDDYGGGDDYDGGPDEYNTLARAFTSFHSAASPRTSLQTMKTIDRSLTSSIPSYEPAFEEEEPVDYDPQDPDDVENPDGTARRPENEDDAANGGAHGDDPDSKYVNGDGTTRDVVAIHTDQAAAATAGGASAGKNQAKNTVKSQREKRIADDKRVTTPYMTKYERARVLGTRALQIR